MDLLDILQKHAKSFRKWWVKGVDLSPELERDLFEYWKEEIPYQIQTGDEGEVDEWIHERLSSEAHEIYKLFYFFDR